MGVAVRLPDLSHWKAQVKCQVGCPVLTDAGRYVQLIAEGRTNRAAAEFLSVSPKTIEKHRAERAGYADALMLDWRGRVAECTGANVFFIKDGALHSPTPDCFLDGITRRTVIALAKTRGIAVHERAIMPEELPGFSECFIVGTAAEVTPVREIGPHNYQPGRLSENLLNDYMAAVLPGK